LYIADDHYLLIPWTSKDFFERDQLVREDLSSYPEDVRNNTVPGHEVKTDWQLSVWDTYDKLKAEGLKGWNYETHTPKILNKQKLAYSFGLFGYQDGMLMWQTAYFNLYPVLGPANLSETSAKKAGFYDADKESNIDTIRSRVRDAIFLNHDDGGLTGELKQVISELFPEPSSYENHGEL
jgi:hypothetical protein